MKAIGRKGAGRAPEPIEEEPRTEPYSVATLAKRWLVSTSTIYSLIASGRLQAFKFGGKLYRIKAEVVDAYEWQEADQTDNGN